jgi:hypothetical protein
VRIAEEHLQAGVDAQLGVLGHLRALVPGQRPAQLLGQRHDRGGDGGPDGLGAVSGQRGAVVDPGLVAMAVHAGQVQQHREPRAAFDQRPDRRAAQPQDEVTLPVPGNRPAGGLGRPLADQDLRGDELLGPPPGPGSWDP